MEFDAASEHANVCKDGREKGVRSAGSICSGTTPSTASRLSRLGRFDGRRLTDQRYRTIVFLSQKISYDTGEGVLQYLGVVEDGVGVQTIGNKRSKRGSWLW